MQVYLGVEALKAPFSGSVVCLGNFDGLHLGHRELIRRTTGAAQKRQLPSVVFTFSPHPIQILAPEKGFRPLFSRQDLVEQLRSMEVSAVILQTFTKEFSSLGPERFIAEFLERPLSPQHVWVGPDFAFGKSRAGTVADLNSRGAASGYAVDVLAAVVVDGLPVSSSRIRQALADGKPEVVTRLLGRNFYLAGQVTPGAGRGRTLGFPTANFTPQEVSTPKRGVYITRTWVGAESYGSVTNVGGAPTFEQSPQLARIETHILDQNLVLKDVQIRVEFISYIREERRFDSAAELVQQIGTDVNVARAYWQKNK